MTRGMAIVATTVASGLIAMQAPINSRLGKSIGTFPAASVSFGVGLGILVGITAITGNLGSIGQARNVTWWYLLGGVLGAIYVTTMLLAVRSLGAGGIIAVTVAGQLTVSVVIDHFGWLGVEKSAVSVTKVMGILLLAVGVALVVRD